MSDTSNNVMVVGVTAIAAAILFLPRLRHAKYWTATVTPLASIIGSGFLVLAPLLVRSFGWMAGPVMVLLCVAAYLFGWAIRNNIACHDAAGESPPRGIVSLERLSSGALALAYVVSVTYYLNLFGSFGVKLTPFHEEIHGRIIATAAFLFIGAYGVFRGLKGLEKLETGAVSLKLAIIAGLIVGLVSFLFRKISDGSVEHAPVGVSGWAAATLVFGMVITVQGFETSRYLGSEYSARDRIRSMRWAQWLAALIYVVYVTLSSVLFDVSQIETSETAVIDMSRVVASVLPQLLVAAALAAQFSAAIADTVGCGGMTGEVSRGRVSENWAYCGVAVLGIVITWTADVFQIIALASRAFAFYYALQCAVATVFAWSENRRVRAACFAAIGVFGLVIVIFSRSVE